MRAAVLFEVGERLRVEEVSLADPGPGEVRVRVAAAGVCHSDLHAVHGDLPVPTPVVLGHEGAGTVEAVGPGVTSVQPGQPVVFSWIPACGRCAYCRLGRPDLCDAAFELYFSGTLYDGGIRLEWGGEPLHHFLATSCFAEAAVVPEAGVIPIPDGVPPERAALVGCAVTTGYGAVVHTARVTPGSSVAVLGCGGVGLNVIQAAALAGAHPILALDVLPAKLELARRFGATEAVSLQGTDDPITPVLDRTAGLGVDYSFEAVGRPETIEAAYGMARKGGTVVIVGVAAPHEAITLNAFSIPSHSKVLTGSWYGRAVPRVDIPKILELDRAGRLNLDDLVSRVRPLEEVNEALDDLRSGQVARTVLRVE